MGLPLLEHVECTSRTVQLGRSRREGGKCSKWLPERYPTGSSTSAYTQDMQGAEQNMRLASE